MDSVLDGFLRDGHGGGLDPSFYTRPQDPGLFICHDCFRLSGRDLCRLSMVPPSPQKPFRLAVSMDDFPLGRYHFEASGWQPVGRVELET